MQDGQYIDAGSRKLFVDLSTYNAKRNAFGYARVTFTWHAAGDIQAALQIATIPSVPYISVRDRCANSTMQWQIVRIVQ